VAGRRRASDSSVSAWPVRRATARLFAVQTSAPPCRSCPSHAPTGSNVRATTHPSLTAWTPGARSLLSIRRQQAAPLPTRQLRHLRGNVVPDQGRVRPRDAVQGNLTPGSPRSDGPRNRFASVRNIRVRMCRKAVQKAPCVICAGHFLPDGATHCLHILSVACRDGDDEQSCSASRYTAFSPVKGCLPLRGVAPRLSE
jgi:hypothetical protein